MTLLIPDCTQVNVIELECASCAGPVSMGVTLGFSLTSLKASTNGPFTGSVKRFSIPLVEGSLGGWKKDSQNSLLPWTTASQCDIIQVLSRLSRIRVLGDWTNWYESVAMDDFRFKNLKGKCVTSVLMFQSLSNILLCRSVASVCHAETRCQYLHLLSVIGDRSSCG